MLRYVREPAKAKQFVWVRLTLTSATTQPYSGGLLWSCAMLGAECGVHPLLACLKHPAESLAAGMQLLGSTNVAGGLFV
jgi:hypothetical protein